MTSLHPAILALEARQALASGQAAALRRDAGVRQQDVADVIGVRQHTVARWETGALQPSWKRSVALGLVLRALTARIPNPESDGYAGLMASHPAPAAATGGGRRPTDSP